ncbi:MAG: hypothetical protein KAV87_52040 [Desulfobacteraceae bacterium]|nr:hypothetical protein [Desulfobacteraceae bacterium]
MTVKDFDKLSMKDFENGAVLHEIRESLRERELLLVRDFKRIANDPDLMNQYKEKPVNKKPCCQRKRVRGNYSAFGMWYVNGVEELFK